MGHNTTLLICNDHFSAIDRDPAGWWEKTKEALRETWGHGPVDYHFGGCSPFWAVGEPHADTVSLIAVGGNYPTVVFQEHWGNRGHHSEEDKVELLRRAAGQLGYQLVKKPSGRTKEKRRAPPRAS